MNARALEAFLARLYTDEALRSAFVEQPAAVARRAGLDEPAVQALACIDRTGLELAARSFAAKRVSHKGKHRTAGLLARLRGMLGRVNPRS